jgi:hypothetical protein
MSKRASESVMPALGAASRAFGTLLRILATVLITDQARLAGFMLRPRSKIF